MRKKNKGFGFKKALIAGVLLSVLSCQNIVNAYTVVDESEIPNGTGAFDYFGLINFGYFKSDDISSDKRNCYNKLSSLLNLSPNLGFSISRAYDLNFNEHYYGVAQSNINNRYSWKYFILSVEEANAIGLGKFVPQDQIIVKDGNYISADKGAIDNLYILDNQIKENTDAIQQIGNNVHGVGVSDVMETSMNYNGSGAIGYDSIAIGDAMAAGSASVAVGSGALATGSNSIAFGTNATATGDGTSREEMVSILSNNKAIRDALDNARADYTQAQVDYKRQKEIWEGQNEALARVNYANEIIAGYQSEIDSILQPNANVANANYDNAKSAYDAVYNDFANRISQIKNIDFSLYVNTSTGVVDRDAMAVQLKNNTEAGSSFNMPVSFYRSYIDNYIKVTGDFRLKEEIATVVGYKPRSSSYEGSINLQYSNGGFYKVNRFYNLSGLTDKDSLFSYSYQTFNFPSGTINYHSDGIFSDSLYSFTRLGELGNNANPKSWLKTQILDDNSYETYKNNLNLFYSNLVNVINNNVNNLKSLGLYDEDDLNEYERLALNHYTLQKDSYLKAYEIAHEQYLYETMTNEADKLIHLGLKEKYMVELDSIMSQPEYAVGDFYPKNGEVKYSQMDFLQKAIVDWCYENITLPKDSVKFALQTVQDGLEGELVNLKQQLDEATLAKNNADKALSDKRNQIAEIQPSQEDIDLANEAEASAQELHQKADKLEADRQALEQAKANLQNLETIATNGESAIAIGANAVTTAKNGIGMGTDALVTGEEAIGIGKNVIASGKNSIAIGTDNSVSQNNSIVIGTNNGITGKDSIAIGNNNVISGENSVAIGNNLNVTEDNVVLIGNRRISGVNDGIADTDAVNVKQLNEAMASASGSGSNENVIAYSSDDHSVITLDGTRGTMITNVKPALLNRNSTDVVIGAQLWATNQNISGFAHDIAVNNASISTLNTGISNAVNAVSAVSASKADISLSNLNDGGRNVIASVVSDVLDDYLNNNNNNSSNMGSLMMSTPITFGLKAAPLALPVDNEIIVTNNDDLTGSGDNVINQAVQDALDTKAEISDVEEGFASVNAKLDEKADLSYVDNELDKKADKDFVVTELDKKANKAELDKKVNTDASNIDVKAWSNELGIGEIVDGNEGLVKGGTVYNALKEVQNNNPISVDDTFIHIGKDVKYDEIKAIDVSNSKDEGRVITGVITNPEDPNSVANVGYVNAVGQNIIAGINGNFSKMNNKIEKVGASAAAMASLTPANYDGDEKWTLSASVGNYRDATAGAIGLFYRPSDKVMVNVRGTIGNEENMVGGGVAVALDKGTMPGVTKAQLVRRIDELEAKNARLEAMMVEILKERKQ